MRDEIFNILKFWLELGVDGFRCDAVPYLCNDSTVFSLFYFVQVTVWIFSCSFFLQLKERAQIVRTYLKPTPFWNKFESGWIKIILAEFCWLRYFLFHTDTILLLVLTYRNFWTVLLGLSTAQRCSWIFWERWWISYGISLPCNATNIFSSRYACTTAIKRSSITTRCCLCLSLSLSLVWFQIFLIVVFFLARQDATTIRKILEETPQVTNSENSCYWRFCLFFFCWKQYTFLRYLQHVNGWHFFVTMTSSLLKW